MDAAGTTKYSYTTMNQALTEDGPWGSDTLTNTYRNGLRTGLGLQQRTGLWTNVFTYDAGMRLSTITSPAGAFSYTYAVGQSVSPASIVRRLLLPNNAYITNNYDIVGRLLSTELRTSAGVLTNAHAYLYNLAGQRTRQTYVNGDYADYTYDPLGQLRTALSYTSGGVPLASQWRGYTYDTVWNLSWRTNAGSPTACTVNAMNELTSVSGGPSYSYNSNGNRFYANPASGPATQYAWDDENRLVGITNTLGGSNQWSARFVYDGLGRLRVRQEWIWAPPIQPDAPGRAGALSPQQRQQDYWQLTNEVHYVYDGKRVIQERDQDNAPTVSYTRGRDLSGTLEGAGGIGGLLGRSAGYNGANGRWSSHADYHADGNGNITFLMNSNQTLAASYRYDPYGNRVASSGPLADANVYRFSSKEAHAASGLYYYLYRWYDPTTQRWPNRDPIQEWGGVNLYVYIGDNPISWIDPYGLYNPISGPSGPVGPGSGLPDPTIYYPNLPPVPYFPMPTYPAPGPEMLWDPNSGTWYPEGGIQTDDDIFALLLPFLAPEASGCPFTRWKIERHGPYHPFGRLGRLPHVQVNWWQPGIKGSGDVIRFPVPPGTPGFPR